MTSRKQFSWNCLNEWTKRRFEVIVTSYGCNKNHDEIKNSRNNSGNESKSCPPKKCLFKKLKSLCQKHQWRENDSLKSKTKAFLPDETNIKNQENSISWPCSTSTNTNENYCFTHKTTHYPTTKTHPSLDEFKQSIFKKRRKNEQKLCKFSFFLNCQKTAL